MKAWQHDETGRITKAPESPGPRWVEIPLVFANIDQLVQENGLGAAPDIRCDCGCDYYTAERVAELLEQAKQHAYADGREDEAFARQRELPRPSDMPVGSMSVRDGCTETQWNHRRNELADGKYLVYAVRMAR